MRAIASQTDLAAISQNYRSCFQRVLKMHKFFKSQFFDFEFLRVLGAAPFQGSEISEVLEARQTLKDNDPEAWYDTWNSWGDKVVALGDEAMIHGDRIAARWAYLRAANYYRASEFFLHIQPSDPRLLNAIKKSSACHDRAMALMETEVMLLRIPYDDGLELPARLYLPSAEGRVMGRTPLIVQTGGFDSTGEELYLYGAAGAITRGYAVLTFDGPGQGLSLRKDRTTLRPDWEYVVGKVLDYVFDVLAPENEDLELDLDRIACIGATMGGYFALRAGKDSRIKAAVSVDGFYSLFEVVRSRMPGFFIDGWLSGSISDKIFNGVCHFLARFNFQLAWEFAQGYWCYGVNNPADMMRFMQTMSLQGAAGEKHLHEVKCPVLIMGGEEAFYFGPEMNARKMMEDLGHLGEEQKELWIGAGPANGGTQAKIADLSLCYQRMFQFLDRQFGIKRFVSIKRN